MSGGGVSSFPSVSLLDSISFRLFSLSAPFFLSSFFLTVSISVVIPLPLFPSSPPLSLAQSLALSPGFSSWPSDTSSWCHFNNLRGEIGNVVSSLNWNGFFTAGCWYSGGRIREAASRIFFINFALGIISVNEEKWCDAKFPFLTSKPHFLDLRWFLLSQSNLSAHLG